MIKANVGYYKTISKGHRPQNTCQRRFSEKVRYTSSVPQSAEDRQVKREQKDDSTVCAKALRSERARYLGEVKITQRKYVK